MNGSVNGNNVPDQELNVDIDERRERAKAFSRERSKALRRERNRKYREKLRQRISHQLDLSQIMKIKERHEHIKALTRERVKKYRENKRRRESHLSEDNSKIIKINNERECVKATLLNNCNHDLDTSSENGPAVKKHESSVFTNDKHVDDDVSSDNRYVQKPNAVDFWDDVKIQEYSKQLKTKLPQLITNIDEFSDTRIFSKPLVCQNYVQYKYKQPQQLFLVSNAQGLLINNSLDFADCSEVHSVLMLEPEQCPVVIIPAVSFWWHKPSVLLMKTVINNLITDIKRIIASPAFVSANQLFELDAEEALKDLIDKIMTRKVYRNNKMHPNTFPMRAYLDYGPPSQITTPIGAITRKGFTPSSWDRLLPASHLHAIFLVSVTGFKITREGYSLDLYLESFLYKKVGMELEPRSGVPLLETFIDHDAIQNTDEDD